MFVDISNDVFKDTLINDWMGSNVILTASIPVIKDIIEKPIVDIDVLQSRQYAIQTPNLSIPLEYVKETEDDVKWGLSLLNITDENDSAMMSMLFPSEFYCSWISYINPLLELYHGYKIYSLPIISIINPISILVAPYLYLTKNLQFDITFNKYLKHLWNILKAAFNSSKDFKSIIIKWISFSIYIGIYLYSIYQTFDISLTLHNFRESLLKRLNGIATFTRTAHQIINNLDENVWRPYTKTLYDPSFILDGTLSDAYCLWTNTWNYNDRLKNLMDCLCAIDVANTVSRLYHMNNWCLVEFSKNDQIMFTGMRNPLLNDTQKSNPAFLQKNIIVTGPNAAGKTTYVKSIVLNTVLAQTIGINMCERAVMKPYEIISTFMRVNDIVGKRSFYEAEVEYCKTMLDKAVEFKDKNILFVMDEPMHSTPPTEGFATAYAVCKYLGTKFNNCRLIITTHYHDMVYLQQDHPEAFINLSVDAIQLENRSFYFPYTIHNNYSFQCIAIELLEDKVFPKEVIDSAIKIKNKISDHQLNQ